MKTQILVYKKSNCGFTETSDLTIREFCKALAFDAFDLTVIDLQDKYLWKSDYTNDKILQDHADISSIRQMMLQSNKAKCIVVLPQNYSFLYSYGYNLETHSEGYKKKKPLKDFIKDFAVSPIGELFSFSLRICFGKSITLVSNKELHSDFSFSMPITSPLKPLLTSNASTISTVLISETLAATTLEIDTNEDLSAVIDAIFPAVVQSVLIPDWLDEVEYHDETAQRARIKEIDEEMALLDKEKKEIEGVLSNYQDIKSVLCSKDFELEKMTRHLLAKIVEVDEDFEDCKEEDFRFSYNDTLYLIEIKGSKGGLKRQHISKTYDHVQIKADAMEDEGSTSKLKGVLIFASQIELKPEERDPFPETQITIARKNDIAVLSTETLLRCYEAYIEKRLTSTSFKETLSQTSGLVSLDLFGLDA
jgi:hypothetical protein